MAANDFLNQYRETQVATADRGQLVVLLYEGAIRFLDEGTALLRDFKTYDQANVKLQRVQEILDELRASLDHGVGGEMAKRLDAIYLYCGELVRGANLSKKTEPLQEARGLLADLLTAWKEVVRRAGVTAPAPRGRGGLNIST